MSFVLSRSRLATAGTAMALIAGTLGLTGVMTVAAPVAAQAAVPAPPAGFTTTWSDDFNGGSGSGADSNFSYDTGAGSTFGTGEIETMTNSNRQRLPGRRGSPGPQGPAHRHRPEQRLDLRPAGDAGHVRRSSSAASYGWSR